MKSKKWGAGHAPCTPTPYQSEKSYNLNYCWEEEAQGVCSEVFVSQQVWSRGLLLIKFDRVDPNAESPINVICNYGATRFPWDKYLTGTNDSLRTAQHRLERTPKT